MLLPLYNDDDRFEITWVHAPSTVYGSGLAFTAALTLQAASALGLCSEQLQQCSVAHVLHGLYNILDDATGALAKPVRNLA